MRHSQWKGWFKQSCTASACALAQQWPPDAQSPESGGPNSSGTTVDFETALEATWRALSAHWLKWIAPSRACWGGSAFSRTPWIEYVTMLRWWWRGAHMAAPRFPLPVCKVLTHRPFSPCHLFRGRHAFWAMLPGLSGSAPSEINVPS